MKKLSALIPALALVFALCACGGNSAPAADTQAAAADNGKACNVTIQFSFPEESGDGAKKVMTEIEEESGGRIKFEPFWSYSFVDAGDVIDALETNQLDIAGFMPSEHPAEMPLNGGMMSLPLMNFPGWTASSKIYLSMLYNNADMMAEFPNNGMVFYAGYMCPGYQFYSTGDITDTSPAAFSGLTVMCDQPQMASFINQNSGGAISAFPPDYLSNLQNGVADALVQHVNCAYVFGCFEYTKSALFFGEGGFYNFPLVYAFSETFWNSLPEDLQEIFAKHAAEFCYESQISDENLYYNAAFPALQENAEITVLDDAAISAWQQAIAPIVTAALEDIAQDSPNADAAYEQLKAMIAGYDEAAFDIGTNNFGYHADWIVSDLSAAEAEEPQDTAAGEPITEPSAEATAALSGEQSSEPAANADADEAPAASTGEPASGEPTAEPSTEPTA